MGWVVGTALGYKVLPLCQASILGLLPDLWTPRQVGWRLFQSQANQVLSLLALENPPYVKNSHLPQCGTHIPRVPSLDLRRCALSQSESGRLLPGEIDTHYSHGEKG